MFHDNLKSNNFQYHVNVIYCIFFVTVHLILYIEIKRPVLFDILLLIAILMYHATSYATSYGYVGHFYKKAFNRC